MNPTTVSTATASGGVALAVVVVCQWGLSMLHVSMPTDVGVAVATVLTALFHMAVSAKLIPGQK